jgi:hypothetical protein
MKMIGCGRIMILNILFTPHFFKSIEKPDLSEDYPSYDITFEPLSVYVSSNVSKHTRECLVHFKNFLVTRCVKSALENFFYWALITGG